ncbi:hypothetical protein PFICI_13574 [Pestalotiopsis fici W106-1]|uniref:NACHT domain-containing protein n=1 Tax=Pestalotiopsis fici (strain W106-1 / CGMCC3.15140) TaxID=1229662 RepID=W3WME6_PESFW|nr:uncharacterized protein PFICI_13574 [Pestalotiopsis fici W106-1]ETS75090.1 hypothetical protein PFICI_13574 [Pestalotiopsis fici W106-1]
MLPSKVGPARIFTCDWPSDLFEDSNFVQKTFDEFARLLQARIEALPPALNQAQHHQRPILFIASCLGGIILMKALVLASPEYIKKAVHGIVFLATPFSGTSFRDVAEWAEPGLRMWAFVRAEQVSNLLRETKMNSDLIKLRHDFTALCREHMNPDCMTAFYEKGKSSLPRKLFPWLPAFLAKEKPLVGEESASLDIVMDRLSLNRSHLLMNKFSGPFDQDYVLVIGRVRKILGKIREGRTLYMADKWISNHCYTTDKLAIQRIAHTDEPLAMENCFINLVIVETPGESLKMEEDRKSSAQFSIHDRLKIREPDEEMQVDIRKLFDPRKGKKSETTKPRRILIRGHAGVGKSTLCKKLIHNFKELGIWRDIFARVLWVPLRNLKRQDHEKKSLRDVLRQEFFLGSPKSEDLSRELEMELEADGGEKTLFILDGLDEVYEGLETDNYMYELLYDFLRWPAVIVTCRPNVSLASQRNLSFDLELETIGFSSEQVNSYMQNVLTIPGKVRGESIPDVQKIESLQSLLQQHQLLQDLIRIPIQLDALCYIWADGDNSLRDGTALGTMTNIYQAIVERLWKKDIPKLHFEDGERPISKVVMEKASLRMIEHDAPRKQYLLERFAFSGFVDNVINFDREYQKAILEEHMDKSQSLPPSEEPLLSASQTLHRLSFWRASNPSAKHPTYHFLHLTFQEYFAARYFVRQWKAKEPLRLGKNSGSKRTESLTTFLMDHRYEARYDVFWRFVTGLLSLEGKEICKFFSLVENSPRDLLGPVHERLIVHCLSEVPPDQLFFSEKRKELEIRIVDWLIFEDEFAGHTRLANEIEVPLASLKAALELGGTATRISIVLALRSRPALPIEFIHLACSWLEADTDRKLKLHILDLLERQKGPPDDLVFEAVVALFRDREERVQDEAISTFECWSLPQNQIVSAIMPFVKDKKSRIRWPAARILGKYSRLDDEIMDDLKVEIEDQESDIPTEVSLDILESQIQYNRDVLGFIAAQLEDKYLHWIATNILQDQPDLDEDIFQTVIKLLESREEFARKAAIKVLASLNRRKEEVEDIVMAHLLNQDPEIRIGVIKALREWPELDVKVLNLLTEALEDKNRDVRLASIKSLEQQPHLSHDILDVVQARAQDQTEDDQVRGLAIHTLMERKTSVDGIDELVKTWLREENYSIQQEIIGALRTWPQPSNEILDTVLERLKEGDHYAQEKALDAVRNWPQFNDTALHAIARRVP